MVNTCEPAQRPSWSIKLKWLTSLSQKARKPEVDLTVPPRGQQRFPVDSRYLTPRDFRSGTWKPRIFSRKGRRTVRGSDEGAGLGCRRKRRPSCNGADTGFNVTRHESEPTSDGCLFARAYGEHLKRGKPSELEVVRPPGGAPPPLASPEPGAYHGSIAKVVLLYRPIGFDQGIGL